MYQCVDVPANILKHAFRSKSFYVYVKTFYDIETMFAKLDEAKLKLEELRGEKYQLFTAKALKHIPTSFALFFYYLREI